MATPYLQAHQAYCIARCKALAGLPVPSAPNPERANRVGRLPPQRQQCRRHLARIDRQLKAVDARIAQTLAADDRRVRRAETLASIPGVGRAAAGLLAAMPEFGGLDAQAAASLARLPPVARESGQGRASASRAAAPGAPPALHGSGHGDPMQPRPPPRVPGPRRPRQAQGRAGRRHACLTRDPRTSTKGGCTSIQPITHACNTDTWIVAPREWSTIAGIAVSRAGGNAC